MADTSLCPMCKSGEIGRMWSKDIILGKKSVIDAAVFFRCQPSEISIHLNEHEIQKDEQTGAYESPDFYMNELLKLLTMFKDWLNYCMNNQGMTRQDMELAIKLGREIRATLETLGDFQGKRGGASQTTVNIDLINGRYKAITNMLMTEVCDECRLKAITLMDQMEKKPKTITSTCELL